MINLRGSRFFRGVLGGGGASTMAFSRARTSSGRRSEMVVRRPAWGPVRKLPWARSSRISYISSRLDMRVAPRPRMMVCSSASLEATRTSARRYSISSASSSQRRSM